MLQLLLAILIRQSGSFRLTRTNHEQATSMIRYRVKLKLPCENTLQFHLHFSILAELRRAHYGSESNIIAHHRHIHDLHIA